MRRGLFAVGVILLILGVAAAGFITYVAQVPVTTNIQTGHQGDLTISALSIGPQFSTIHWSNALATDRIYVTTSSPLTCTQPAGQIASGTGPSGTFSLTLNPSTHYYVFDCSTTGSLSAVSVGYTTLGLNIITIGGIAFAVIGVVLLVISLRKAEPLPVAMGGAPPGSTPPAGSDGPSPPR